MSKNFEIEICAFMPTFWQSKSKNYVYIHTGNKNNFNIVYQISHLLCYQKEFLIFIFTSLE